MTKQEEIREKRLMERRQFIRGGVKWILGHADIGDWDDEILFSIVDDIFRYMGQLGVVIKVERELPSTYLGSRKIEKTTNKMPDYGGGMFEDNVASVQDEHTKKVMRDADYVPTEPLV